MKTLCEVPLAGSGDDLDFGTFDHLQAYREHGPVYKVLFRGEEWVCLGGLEANDLAWRIPDSWSYEKALGAFTEVMGPTHVTQLDGVPHRRKRRNLKPGFAMSAVVKSIPQIDRVVSENLAAHAGSTIELHDAIMEMLTVANSQTTVHYALSSEQVRDFITFEEDFIANTSREANDRRAYYNRPEFVALKERVLGTCASIAEARLGGERQDDNLQAMLDDRSERDTPATVEELTSEIYLLLMAGTGNTAKTLNCGLQHLVERPDWLAELSEELSNYSPEALMQGMSAYPKMKASILEMERLFPAAPVMPRTVAEPIEFEDTLLEPGTKVLHLHTLTHFLEEIYPDPYAFKPERWLEETPPRKAHGTFGGGTHVCLGMNLARLHMPIFLGNLLRDYDFSPKEQSEIRVKFHYGVPQTANLEIELIKAD